MEAFIEKTKTLTNKILLYITLILVGAVLTTVYFKYSGDPKKSIYSFQLGEFSVSITERSELVFLDRDRGTPYIADSTLTEAINNMLAAREYVKVNASR
jgi:hypothetical protein